VETEIRCHWTYTHPAWGRVMTMDPFTEADALRLLPDAERAEGTDVVAPIPLRVGHAFASGLVRRKDGAMVPPK
jgi:hypothetical protein